MMQATIHRPAATRHLLNNIVVQARTTRPSVIISSSGFMHLHGTPQDNCSYQRRRFSKKSPGNDPLELLKQSSVKRDYCDEDGYRNKHQHWIFGIATSGDSLESAPTLRTLDFQRVTSSGIDFIRKRGKGAAGLASSGKSSTLLCSFGKYRPGETVEQWLAEGQCEQINLLEEDGSGRNLLSVIPSRSIVEIVASMVVKEEEGKGLEEEREPMEKHSHYMEVVQRTRQQLEKGDLTKEEIEKGIMAVRFVPYHMERLVGGPDQVMWERWQWDRDAGACPEGTPLWDAPKLLLPY
mmetsp:Transcript_10071/g.20731  ORF Transcript_10071/g.20731 Transcript_10071/m.20731 type:complete len:294 (+) Transcript_10071:276-1157(+)